LAQGCATCTPVCLRQTRDLAIAAASGCASCSTALANGCISGCSSCMTSCSTQCVAGCQRCSACLSGCSTKCSGCLDDMAQRGRDTFASCAAGCTGLFGTTIPARIGQAVTRTQVSLGTTFRMRISHTYNVAIPRNIAWAKTIGMTRQHKFTVQRECLKANVANRRATGADKDEKEMIWKMALDAKWAAEDARLALWRGTPAASIVMEGRNAIVDREKKEQRYRVEDAFCKEMDSRWFEKWQESYPGMESYRETVLRRLVEQGKAIAPRGTEDPMYKLGEEPLAPIDEAEEWTCDHCGRDNVVEFNPLFCGNPICDGGLDGQPADRPVVVPEPMDSEALRSINELAGLGYDTKDAEAMQTVYLELKKTFQDLRQAKRDANEEAQPQIETTVKSVVHKFKRDMKTAY